ncbi:MAG: periplasmic heavy metal sensor [Bacteroidota bacterium]
MKKITLCWGLAFGLTLSALAQQKDPLGSHLFPPELIMAHQNTLGMSETQKNAIKELMKNAQNEFTDLNWEMQDLTADLLRLVAKSKVDEAAAQAQLAKVLQHENLIKQKQFTFMIRLKNLLSESQQKKLNDLRK